MSLRLKFLLFVVIMHLVLVVLAARVMRTDVLLFVGLELLLLVSIVLSVQLYRGFLRPFQLIAAGTEAMRSQDFSMKFRPVGQQEMDQLIAVYNHMIDALRQERVSRHENNQLLESLIQASPAGVLLLSFEGRIAGVNPAAERILDRTTPQLLGQLPDQLPGLWGPALAALAGSQGPQVVRLSGLETYRAHGAQFIDRGFPRRFILLEELTRELIRQEKQAYEQLIRMMSHEVNNSIGAINSLLQSLHHYAPQLAAADQPDFREALDVAWQRNTNLVNFTAGFANLVRLPPPQRQPTDVHTLLHHLERLLHVQAARRRIRWHTELAEGPLLVELDPQQLEQALLNIAKNALEAIGEDGNVWVRTSRQPATLVIENDGPGLAPEVQQRLFTPFFSTKRDGQGIGLTLTRDILLQHQFRFSLATQPNGRTAFTIWFSVSE